MNFAVALSTLMLEILMTRITSVIAWYHLAFFVIALAMLGMTAGAIVANGASASTKSAGSTLGSRSDAA